MHLAHWDWLIIGVYAVVVITIGLRAGRKQHTSEGYFLAGRRLKWPFIGASIYAANISAEHFVGLAGCGYLTGLAFGCYEWIAVFCLIPLIVLFLPFYIRNRIYTVPEFLERRFGPGVRLCFSAFMVLLSVLAKISISLWAASLVFHEVLGWNQMVVIWVVGLVTALYTMKGGLSAVVFTDAIQAAILIAAAIILTGIGLHEIGGVAALRGKLDPSMFSMVKPATDPDLPWPGVFIGVFFVGTFYFSMDQVLVQRVFAAENLNEGRLGATFCAFLKTINPLILVGPGIVAAALYPGLMKGDLAYPTMLNNLMPTGLLGLTIAGITAALMGHLSATYNSVGTLVTRDFYLKIKPDASQARQILVGRIVILAVFVLGALWAPAIGQSKSMFIYLQTVSAYLMMPFAGIFLFAVFWKRANAQGVLACIIAVLVLVPVFMVNSQRVAAKHAAAKAAADMIAMTTRPQAGIKANDLLGAAKALVDNAAAGSAALADSKPLEAMKTVVLMAERELEEINRDYLIAPANRASPEGRAAGARQRMLDEFEDAKQAWVDKHAPELLTGLAPAARDVQAAVTRDPSAGFIPLMTYPILKPWLHGAMVVAAICMLVLVVVSLLTAPPPPAMLKNTTVASLWGTEAQGMDDDEMMAPETCWFRDYRLWLTLVSAGTAWMWYLMR